LESKINQESVVVKIVNNKSANAFSIGIRQVTQFAQNPQALVEKMLLQKMKVMKKMTEK
jgi:hypothetical protein